MESELKKCSKCRGNMLLKFFSKNTKTDIYYKTCDTCRERNKQDREAKKCIHNKAKYDCKECQGGRIMCIHNKRKSRCRECGGSQICVHNRRKHDCRECVGSQICLHNKQKSRCKECKGSKVCAHNRDKYRCRECGGSDICIHDRRKVDCKECSCPIKITIKRWIYSKTDDKRYNRFDIVNHIDKDFCKLLIEEYPKCYYTDCQVELQYIEYNDTLATIERKDNNIGHIKANCVICCMKCNKQRKSNRT